MGQEIEAARFTDADFAAFDERLREETKLLETWFEEGVLAGTTEVGGFELEAWLVGQDMLPAPVIEPFLERLNDPLVVPELATFNAEINGTPQPLRGDALSRLAKELESTWARCNRAAAGLNTQLAMIGILPTVRPEHLVIDHMTPRKRYRALNEQILNLRRGRPLSLEIRGKDRLYLEQEDVMLESAATSFQIHLKVGAREAARVYNCSKILAAPMVGVSANSPFLFGCELWDETRIPLFEQAVSVGGSILSERVNFGIRYAEHSILECFRANLVRYPVLLPQVMGEPPERLAHLRLHNGTIWRWNRPLIGFDNTGAPHLRIEHRVVPAGPTVADAIANAAFYFGAVHSLAREEEPPEQSLPFPTARNNFYAAARAGLQAEIQWLDGRVAGLAQILKEDLLPRARRGLLGLGIMDTEADHWLGIIAGRLENGQTGAAWQRAFVGRHGAEMPELTSAYLERQQAGRPVHEWTL
ncbi:MAG: glutamate--cysteine ligase [Pseudomonadota bacterium]|nr:glutamate--cysteine ligase [Pseudomonadota bacterium]